MSTRKAISLVETLVVVGMISILVSLLLPAIQNSRESSRRVSCQNNLHQIAIAVLAHESTRQRLPPGTIDQQTVTWGTAAVLLTHFDRPELSAQDLSGPCLERISKSPVLQKSVSKPLPQFSCPTDPYNGTVLREPFEDPKGNSELPLGNYVGVSGSHVPQVKDNGVLFAESNLRMASVTDGTSKTLLMGERRITFERAVHGSVFSAMAYFCSGKGTFQFQGIVKRINDPAGMRIFSSRHSGGAYFNFVDGHVSFLTDGTDVDTLRSLATRNGNEIGIAN